MNQSRVSIVMSQIIEKVEKIAGGCWGVFFALIALYAMFDDEKDGAGLIMIMWLLAALGFSVFYLGMKRTKMRMEFKKYIAHLSADPSGSLENLASATGASVDKVKKNLKYMINKRFFTDAFINEQTSQLIFPSMAQRLQQQAQTMPYAGPGTAQPELVVCTCRCCGGINKIAKGTAGECDYCGSPLQG